MTQPAENDAADIPRAGETWKWMWLWATITKAGPKRVTYWTGSESISTPTDQFLSRFQRAGLTEATAPTSPAATACAESPCCETDMCGMPPGKQEGT